MSTETIATTTEITINRGTVKAFVTAARKALRLPGKSFCSAKCTISQDADGVTLHATTRFAEISLLASSEPGPDCLFYLTGDELASLAGTRKETATITISASGYGATITWKAGSASCEMFARAEPESVELDNTATWHVPGLLEAIHRAETCCDTESTRYALSGYLLTAEEGQPTDIVATDSRQLLCQHGAIPADTITRQVIVPAIGLRSIFGRRFDQLEIGQDDAGRVVFVGDGWRIRLEGVEGRFPMYEPLMRTEHDTVLKLAPADCQAAGTWDTTTDDDETMHVQLNGKLQTVIDQVPRKMNPATRYVGEQTDTVIRQRYWNRGTAIQPESVGFYQDSAIVFRSAAATYLAMPLTRD